jgi:uroporphyrinogen decarboxylase
MNRRELIQRLIAGESVERCGLWLGKPNALTWPILHEHFGTTTEEEFRQLARDDCRWVGPQSFPDVYQDPRGLKLFDSGLDRLAHANPPLADAETVDEVEAFPWPDPDHLHFDSVLRALDAAGDAYRFSGFWTCYFHNISDLLGMEEYMIKMYTHPEVVQAVTDRVCGFYLEANTRFFEAAGDRMDGFFFGNDFGTQRGMICGPEQFDRFMLPWLRRFADLGKSFGHQIIVHSCGAIHSVIGRLIAAGVDCLHPLQALAADMDAATLARDFKGRIAFMGGIDAQQLLTHGTPDEVRADVRRVKALLGPNLIVSPSHEAILPNVPPGNIRALIEAATG